MLDDEQGHLHVITSLILTVTHIKSSSFKVGLRPSRVAASEERNQITSGPSSEGQHGLSGMCLLRRFVLHWLIPIISHLRDPFWHLVGQ
jgi:hypothetical protein